MVKYLFILLICLIPGLLFAQIPVDTTNIDIDTTGQKDMIDVARALFHPHLPHNKSREKKDVYFSILPFTNDVPGSSKALVTSTNAGFYMGNRKSTYISSILFTPYTNFKGRYGLPIHSSLWTDSNKYNIQGEVYFLRYPADTWGLGGGQNENDKVAVNYDYIRFYQNVLRRIKPYLYIGVGYNLDYYVDINTDNAVLPAFTGYKYGTGQNQNAVTTGVTINVLYDTRQNLFNPIPGSYLNFVYRHNAEFIGSGDNAQSIYLDLRKYVSLNTGGLYKNIIAFWTYYWTTLTPGTPYLALPAIGMDPYNRSGRGIEQSRYRGNSLFYFESEYRRDITKNGLIGFVLFANINSATQPNTYHFSYLNPAAGGGLRLQLNKKSGTNFCFDYGFSRGYSDLILSLGEAF